MGPCKPRDYIWFGKKEKQPFTYHSTLFILSSTLFLLLSLPKNVLVLKFLNFDLHSNILYEFEDGFTL